MSADSKIMYGPPKPPVTERSEKPTTIDMKSSDSIAVNDKHEYAFTIVDEQVIAQTSLLVGKIIFYEQPLFLHPKPLFLHPKPLVREQMDWTLLHSFIELGPSKRNQKKMSFHKTKEYVFHKWDIKQGDIKAGLQPDANISVELKHAIDDAIIKQVEWELAVIKDQYPLVNGQEYKDEIYQNILSLYREWCAGLGKRCVSVTDWMTQHVFGYGIYEYTSLIVRASETPNCLVLFEGNGTSYLIPLEPIQKGERLIGSTFTTSFPALSPSPVSGMHLPTCSHQLQYQFYTQSQVEQLVNTSCTSRHMEIQWFILQKAQPSLEQWRGWFGKFLDIYFRVGWVWGNRLSKTKIATQLATLFPLSNMIDAIRWKILHFFIVYEPRVSEIKRVIQEKDQKWTWQSSHVCFRFLTEWASINPSLFESDITIWNRMIQPFPVSFYPHYFKLLNDAEYGILSLYKQLNQLMMSHDLAFVEDCDHPIRVERLFE